MLIHQLMKIGYIVVLGAIPFAFVQTGLGQDFINLNFEQATHLSPVPIGQYGGMVPIANALPGWTGYLGANQVTQVLQDNFTLGNASIDIIGPNWTNGIIEGDYTVVLEEGVDPYELPNFVNVNASISQVGLVPVGANSIQLKEWGSVDFTVSFAGQNLALIPIGVGSGYTLYGADISPFAGQVGALTITELAGPHTVPATPDYFDSIVFSLQTVPEPSSVVLLVLGGLFCCWQAKFARGSVASSNR